MTILVEHPGARTCSSLTWFFSYMFCYLHLCCGLNTWERSCMGNPCAQCLGGCISCLFCGVLTCPLIPIGLAMALTMGLVFDAIICLLWAVTFGWCFQCCTLSCRLQAVGFSRGRSGHMNDSPRSDWETCQGGDELCEQFVRLDTMFDGGYSPFELCTGGFVNWPLYRCITCQFVCPRDASDSGEDGSSSSSGGPIIYLK
eukprot:TRINITY_DN2293_c0_g1_i3.p1 TRINITY_DN2293_c0_g1~~TRINITY_DN2293_c0_g1_i3.p1  ORF type:complete len:224 (+),score=1.38 TRINITY_DN2293_c0_g1_i3:75-674(+)